MKALLLVAGWLAAAGTTPEGVRGVVVDGNDRPVAGALVVLVQSGRAEEADRQTSTRSDDHGRFAFDAWRDDGSSWHVLAYKAGLALGGAPVPAVADQAYPFGDVEKSPNNLKLRLLQPSKARVRLEGPSGQPPGDQTGVSLVRLAMTREHGTDGGRSLVFMAPVPRALAGQLGLRLD